MEKATTIVEAGRHRRKLKGIKADGLGHTPGVDVHLAAGVDQR